MERKRAAIYVRTVQGDRFPNNQAAELRAFAEARGWTVSGEYVDKAESPDAPSLDKLMRAAREGQIDAVLVWRFDRLARSLDHLVATLNEFQTLGIGFVSLGDAIDTTVPSGQVMLTMVAAMAKVSRPMAEA